jgi:glycine C-acetyltransferase
MLRTFHDELAENVAKLKAAGTYKGLRVLEGPMDTVSPMEGHGDVLVLSSNNYLGLANHPEVVKAGQDALAKFGAGTASVRFICGTFRPHRDLEDALAKFFSTESALTYVSCWCANTGLVPALVGPEDAVISDQLNHASLIDACRLASKTRREIYRHADMKELKEKLEATKSCRRRLILTDGVFSMEGDLAPLPDILELARRYQAIVLVDDSHGTGVMGKRGCGIHEHFGVEGEVDIITSTLGKALGGAAGGFVASGRALCDMMVQVSRPHLFSNALPVTVAASALKALEVLEREPQRVARLREVTRRLREGLKSRGFKPLEGESAIIPIIVGETALAIRMSRELLKEGVFVTGFGYPVVPEGVARLRVQACAALTDAQIEQALGAFTRVSKRLSATPR